MPRFLSALVAGLIGTCSNGPPTPGGRGLRERSMATLATLLFLPAATFAQSVRDEGTFRVESWKTADGLPQNSVQAIAQSREGYLWVGTKGGLARFDGVRFTHYGLADGLKGLVIIELLDDGQGGVWIGTLGGGLSHWTHGAITTLTMEDGLAHNDVMALALADDGGLWVGSKGGLQHLGAKGFTRVEEAEGLKHEVVALASGPGQGLWITVEEKGLFHYIDGRCEAVAGPPKLELFHGYRLVLDRAGALWVGVGNGMVLRRDAGKWTVFNETDGLPYSYIYCLAEGAPGEIWAGSHEEGLFVFRDGRFQPVPTGDPSIRSVCMGRDGVVWAGLQSEGLCRIAPRLLTTVQVGGGKQGADVNGLVEDPAGELWVGSFGGGLHHGPLDRLEAVRDSEVLREHPYFTTALKMSDGTLYFGGAALLLRREADSGELNPVVLSGNYTALCEAADGSLLIGTREGEIMRLVDDVPRPVANWTPRAPITALVRGPEGSVWVATGGAGLFRWEKGTRHRWTTAEGLPTDVLRTLHQDAAGTLWIGTAGGGLAWFENGRLHSVDSRQGLGGNVISQILEDDRGHLWLGGNNGILRVSKTELREVAEGRTTAIQPLVLDESDGMLAAECSGGYSPAGLKSRSGTLYFSTVRGIVEVRPEDFDLAAASPIVRVEEIMLDGRTLPVTDRPLVLPPGSDELEIRYTAFNYAKPQQLRFRHRVRGLNANWSEGNHARLVRFSWLPPGNYSFNVSAANQDGIWNEKGATLAFTVLPFYWQTLGFRILAGLGLAGTGAGVVWMIARGKLQRHRAELAHQRALSDAELRMDLAADAAELGVWERDPARDVIWASEQWRALFDFAPEDPLNIDVILQKLHPDDREAVRQLLAQELLQDRISDKQYRVLLGDGTIRWIASRSRPEFDGVGQAIRVRGVAIDVTRRKLAEDAALELSRRLIHSQETERNRLARELHDDLGQSLALLSVELEMFGQDPPTEAAAITGRMARFSSQVKGLSSDIHQIAHELHPAKLEQLGLAAAVRGFCKEFGTAHGIAIVVDLRDIPRELPKEVALCLYRILQEALQNVIKHSEATVAKVELVADDSEISIIITDDGCGFDSQTVSGRGSLGLVSMRERARMVQGRFSVASLPGTGTRIETKVPLGRPAEGDGA